MDTTLLVKNSQLLNQQPPTLTFYCYLVLWVVSFPQCTASPNTAESCCIPLHTTASIDTMIPNIADATMLELSHPFAHLPACMDTTIPNIADPTMLGVVASLCTPLPAWTQRFQTLLMQQCWSCRIPLHTIASIDTTIPNITDPTMLGVVASLCTPLLAWTQQFHTLLIQQCWGLLHPFAASLTFYM